MEHTRVGFLLDAIQTSDAGLQAAIAAVKTDDKPAGKRNNFEKMASYIVPYDPVNKKCQTGSGQLTSNISATEEVSSTFGSKVGIGKTGVHLRYHTKEEYDDLPVEKRTELHEWRRTMNPKKKGGGKTKTKWTPKGSSKGSSKGGSEGDSKDNSKSGKRNLKNTCVGTHCSRNHRIEIWIRFCPHLLVHSIVAIRLY
jgi:hypothetical protein